MGVFGFIVGVATFAYNVYTGARARNESKARSDQDLINTATSWRQTAAGIEAQAEALGFKAEDSFEEAELHYENAENKLDTGKDIYKQAAQSYDVKKTAMRANQGATTAAVGRSSMEFQGSADRLLIENARQMTRDLTVLRNITSSKWDAMMGQRTTDILSGENAMTSRENLLTSQDTYEGIAADYISDAEELEGRVGGPPTQEEMEHMGGGGFEDHWWNFSW